MRNIIVGISLLILGACAGVPQKTQLFNTCNTAYAGLNSLYVFNDRLSDETTKYVRVLRDIINRVCIDEEYFSVQEGLDTVNELIWELLELERKAENVGG